MTLLKGTIARQMGIRIIVNFWSRKVLISRFRNTSEDAGRDHRFVRRMTFVPFSPTLFESGRPPIDSILDRSRSCRTGQKRVGEGA